MRLPTLNLNQKRPLFQIIVDYLLIAGIGATLVVPHGVGIWPVLFALAGLIMLLGRLKQSDLVLTPEILESSKLLVSVTVLAVGVPLSIDLLHENKISLDPYLALLFLPALSIVIYRNRVRADVFFTGVAVAAVLACGLAIYQHFYTGIGRARGFMNPIPFGDVCVLFSLTLIVRATGIWKTRPAYATFLGFGMICGAYASLLSGSKGGWLALLAGLLIGGWRFLSHFNLRSRSKSVLLISLLFCGSLILPEQSIRRVESGLNGALHWIETGEISEGSVSARFEMWNWGFLGFQQSPLIGLPKEDLLVLRQKAVDDGLLDPKILQFPDTKDNEFINQAANRGLVGLLISAMTFAIPFLVFRRYSGGLDNESKDLSLTGQLLVLSFVEFGLSVSIWGTSTFRFVYISWIVLLLTLIAVCLSEQKEKRRQP